MRRLLLLALFLVAAPVRGEVLFATNFDSMPDASFVGNPAPSPTTKKCGDPDDTPGEGCVDPCPLWAVGEGCAYVGGDCGDGHCTVEIESLYAYGGSGKAFHHWDNAGGGGATSSNDGILFWFATPDVDHTVTYPELWVRGRMYVPPGFADTGSQLKTIRIYYYPGSGARQGDTAYGGCRFDYSYGCQRPSMIVDLKRSNGGSSDMQWTFAPRTHVGYGVGSDIVYIDNDYGTRYCSGSSGATCIPGEIEASCPGSCSGSVVPDGAYGGNGFDFGMAGHLGHGEWVTMTFQMRANTMGASNGIFRAWWNGSLQFERTNYQWFENTPTVKFRPESPTETNKFWTGNATPLTPGMNAVALGGNNNYGGVPSSQAYAWDDWVVATTLADLDNHPFYGVSTCDNDGDCSNSLTCDGAETCEGEPGGTCSPGTPVSCDDSNACTTDSCVEGAACDADPSDNGDCCTNVAVTCDDSIACTVDACNAPTVGCIPSDQRATTCTGGTVCNLTTGACDVPGAPTPIVEGDLWLTFNGTGTATEVTGGGNDWAARLYDDTTSSWTNFSTGLGYGACTGSINQTTGSGARNYYMRKHFNVDDASLIGTGTLSVAYDDGFRCWLNGTQIASVNVSDDDYGSIASATHSCGGTNASYEQFAVPSPSTNLVDGDNVIACRALNFCTAATSSACSTEPSMFFSAALDFTLAAATPACSDSIDNDGDGATDYNGGAGDPGCTADSDTSEYGTAACDDGADNDSDSLTDYRVSGGDPGCSSLTDTTETDAGGAACDNGSDDDGDGLIDMADIQCQISGPTGTTEINCGDGVVSAGESCESGVAITTTCAELSPTEWGAGGNLLCDECVFNTEDCVPLTVTPTGLQRSDGVTP